MKTDLWLPTKAAADALGISTDTLKRKREICGGFLEAGHHWCAGATPNSPMTSLLLRLPRCGFIRTAALDQESA